jgi:hypothetical protein
MEKSYSIKTIECRCAYVMAYAMDEGVGTPTSHLRHFVISVGAPIVKSYVTSKINLSRATKFYKPNILVRCGIKCSEGAVIVLSSSCIVLKLKLVMTVYSYSLNDTTFDPSRFIRRYP